MHLTLCELKRIIATNSFMTSADLALKIKSAEEDKAETLFRLETARKNHQEEMDRHNRVLNSICESIKRLEDKLKNAS